MNNNQENGAAFEKKSQSPLAEPWTLLENMRLPLGQRNNKQSSMHIFCQLEAFLLICSASSACACVSIQADFSISRRKIISPRIYINTRGFASTERSWDVWAPTLVSWELISPTPPWLVKLAADGLFTLIYPGVIQWNYCGNLHFIVSQSRLMHWTACKSVISAITQLIIILTYLLLFDSSFEGKAFGGE